MNEDLMWRLRKKGWTDEDIYHAVKIIERGRKKKPKNIIFLDSMVYWVALLIALVGNFIISIILIPFMISMSGVKLYAIITIIGFAFGAFFDLLIRDIKKIQNKDVIIAGIFLPLLALINVNLMVTFSNYLQEVFKLSTVQHNPMVISVMYVIAFIIPYMINGLRSDLKKKKSIVNNV